MDIPGNSDRSVRGSAASIAAILPLKITGRHYRENLGRLDVLFSSILNFGEKNLLDEIVIVVQQKESDLIQAFCANWPELPINLVSEKDHFEAFERFNKPWQVRPWQRQQIIKLNAPSLTQADFVLTLDPDVVLRRYASRNSLAPGGYALLQEESRRVHPRWWRDSAALLGLQAELDRPGMGVTPALLAREVLLALHDRLTVRAGRPWMEVLLTTYSDWTEYTLYLLTAQALGLIDRHHIWCGDHDHTFSTALHVSTELSVWSLGSVDGSDSDSAVEARIDRIFTSDDMGLFAVIQSNTGVPSSLVATVASRRFPIRNTDVDLSSAPRSPSKVQERSRTAARLIASSLYRLGHRA